MSKKISTEQIKQIRVNLAEDKHTKVVRNAMIKTNSSELSMDWDKYRKIDHSFSHVVSGEMPATNQKSSGRCWGFAGLNLFRIYLGRKHNLKDFEFSQNYFMFWDKLEKANYFLENIIKTRDENYDSRLIMHLVKAPVQDGGQWDMFVNLIEKYGAVPKDVMPETNHSSKSMAMNYILTHKLRDFASTLRKKSAKQSAALKKDMMET